MRNDVRDQRTRRGLSQSDLAKALGVSRQTIISIEKERFVPSLPLAIALARYFAENIAVQAGSLERSVVAGADSINRAEAALA